ncbi:hypothetical protein F0U44_13640 [Nocardioides humilatus]|uniref:Uncharacterized protein n=1 Tax=Nocardioides humilatus TaxID=2607660 RepID=A0A5B1LIP9_9ACTN|nr:hypothetical protein [Nocardioides humilatus]KAA1419467.1 hypothetical protein F0U44_13640 [Nocardioides humilatus]
MRTPRPSVGTIVAGTAVVLLATTGTAYAAATIGSAEIIDDSVRSVDIKNESIASIDILNNSVTTADLRNNSVQSMDVLDGTLTGDDVTDYGLTNQDIGVLAASINADGSIDHQSGGIVSSKPNTGQYLVSFAVDVDLCTYSATVGPVTSTGMYTPGWANVYPGPAVLDHHDWLLVDTYNASGVATDQPFHLIVVC